ncbi:MAG: tRNA pseudouridine(38-40) synthase TruA [Methanomassiliicoccales archaeon]|nr:tRNA pseudouridine(38-40) synthase TruA [Methanomassiliicoccales archaeon]
MSWRAAVKLAYDGRDFYGSQRQPGVPTVEDEVIRALQKVEAMEDPVAGRFQAASRTDRGVSALGNVMAFDTGFRQRSLLRALNSASERVHFYAWAEVPSSFSPRRASGRWYRYFLPCEGLDPDRVVGGAQLFEGRHDFRRFCKADGRSTLRTLDRVSVMSIGDFLVIDLEAREFLRNMVRRIVAALEEVGSGKMGEEDVSDALTGKDVQFGLAPPDNLWLMDVRYPFEFRAEAPPNLRARVGERARDAMVRLAFYDSLGSRFP